MLVLVATSSLQAATALSTPVAVIAIIIIIITILILLLRFMNFGCEQGLEMGKSTPGLYQRGSTGGECEMRSSNKMDY